MRTLARVTNGSLGGCVRSRTFNGYLICDGFIPPEPEPDEKDILSGARKSRRGFAGWLIPPTVSGTDEEIREAITHSPTENVERTTEDADISMEIPAHMNKESPLDPEAKPIGSFEDRYYQALVAELRIAEIKRHARQEQLYAEELQRQEEELAVLLLAATL